ncbi:MAG TPA: globin domain-containing protein [Streptosporangiaceae bacterium]
MDAGRLKANFALVAANGDVVAEYFYADLFERNPRLRSMFPQSMGRQHKVLLGALSHIVSTVDDSTELVPYLERLGRDHRGFGVVDEYYPEVGTSLVATLRYFSGDDWDDDLEGDWSEAYGVVAKVMAEAR